MGTTLSGWSKERLPLMNCKLPAPTLVALETALELGPNRACWRSARSSTTPKSGPKAHWFSCGSETSRKVETSLRIRAQSGWL